MPLSVLCRSCGRQHSVVEYEEDRFCRGCGSLLIIDYSGASEGGGWRRIFPYEPYPPQIEFMGDVARVVGGGGVLIAEACNGFGKTASALSGLLSLGKPIVYATRTHEQVRQVLAEVEAINEKSGSGFTAVNLASRQHLCPNPECRDLPQREAVEACRVLQQEDECPYETDISRLPPGLPPVLWPKALFDIGNRLHLCPYFLARRAAAGCMVVVTPYPYVFDHRVRVSAGLELSGRVLILDEGHNIDRVGQDSLSDSLSQHVLEAAVSELRSIKKPSRQMVKLIEHIEENASEETVVRSAETLERELELALGVDLRGFVDLFSPAIEEIRRSKLLRGEAPVSYLSGVLSFLGLVSSSRKDRYVAVYERSVRGVPTLQFRCLDPSLAVKPIVEEASGTLIMSGTLSPIELFADILGLVSAVKKAYPPIQSSEKIRTIIDVDVTTTFGERTEEMITRLGRKIALDLMSVENGALVFFTQRGFMTRSMDLWGVNGIIDVRMGRLYLGGKPAFVEGRTAQENREVVERYKQAAVGPEGAVLFSVFRGRNSEGSNFPDEQARGIFLVGVPYADYGDQLVRAQIRYFSGRAEGLGHRWYTMDAFRAANQAMGRGIRGRDDWCHYWLLDNRYAEHVDLLSGWALGKGPEIRKGQENADG